MSDLPTGNAVIGQSGGPTAVINQSMIGCVEGLLGAPQIEKIYGAHHAVSGMLKGDFIELQGLSAEERDLIAGTPSAALGSSRDKPDEAYCQKVVDVLKAHNIRYFFYAGGNDSSDTCRIVNEQAAALGYELRSFHIPKTVDNDLMCNDHTPGFGSAAKTVASAMIGDNLDNKALAGVKINVCMGRHAGFLTAAAVLARQHSEDGPHLIYVPERVFDTEKFIADVQNTYDKYGRCLIAVSEGIHNADGDAIVSTLMKEVEKDAHGNVQLSGTGALGDQLATLVKEKTGIKRVRADTLGYMQRSFPMSISEVDQAEARAAGKKAAELALSGEYTDGSVAIQRVEGIDEYKVEYNRIELTEVAAKTRHLPEEYIVGDNDIADSYVDYLLPLVGKMPKVGYLFK